MSAHDLAIHGGAARRIHGVLVHVLEASGAADALLIDRNGQLLAQGGADHSRDPVALSALAAAAFSSTAAMARLLGEPEFSMLFHQGLRQSVHITAVDGSAILLVTFDRRTTAGIVRLFAKEAGTTIGAILAEARTRPPHLGDLAAPLTMAEARPMFRERSPWPSDRSGDAGE